MPINVERVKYLVAREGLVIVACVVIAFVFGYIDNYRHRKYAEYKDKSMKYELIEPFKGEKVYQGFLFSMLDKSVLFPIGTDNVVIYNTIERDYGNNVEGLSVDENAKRDVFDKISENDVVARYNHKGDKIFNWFFWKINTKFIFLAFFAYPIYLLGRFVIWSVKTIHKNVQSSEDKQSLNDRRK